jgi:hypothetical protein
MKILFLIIALFISISCSKKEDNKIIEIPTEIVNIEQDNESSEVLKESVNIKQNNYEKYEYVNSFEGLMVKESPDIFSEIIFSLKHREEVKVLEIGSAIIIDNIEGNWVLIETQDIKGWVFNGYLVQEKEFNIFTDAGKTIEIVNAGYYLIERSWGEGNENEIGIILSDKNFDLNYSENDQTVENYSIVRLWIPEDCFISGEFEVYQEGDIFHSDKTPSRNFKIRELIIELVDGYIKINFKVNMYIGARRIDELVELNYIGPIIKLPYKYLGSFSDYDIEYY